MFKATLKTLTATTFLLASSLTFAADVDMNADINDLAIQGYDPVSYFTKLTPTKGNVNYTATYKGGIYRFTTEENRDLFRSNPTKYAPQFGGFCAFGVSMDKKFDTDPLAWKIVEDKLYLNLNKNVQKKWLTDVSGYVSAANDSWGEIKNVATDDL